MARTEHSVEIAELRDLVTRLDPIIQHNWDRNTEPFARELRSGWIAAAAIAELLDLHDGGVIDLDSAPGIRAFVETTGSELIGKSVLD